MNWKIFIVSCVALSLVICLLYFQVIGIDIGIVPVIFSLIGIFSPIMSHLLKPKVSLYIEAPQFERREYGNHEGYKIRTKVTNKGRKIVFNLVASVCFTSQIEFLGVRIETTDGHKSYDVSSQPFEDDKYSWIDKKGKSMKDISLKQLRKDDSIELMFPKEAESGVCFGELNGPYVGFSYDTLLKLKTSGKYQVEITLKGEDFEKNTVIKKKTFRMKVPS